MTKTTYSGHDFDITMLEGEPDGFTQILDDLEHGVHDPALPCWTVDNVSFEMDNILVSDEESESSMDSDSDTEHDFKDNLDSEAQN